MRFRPFPPLSSLGLPAWLGTLAAFALLCAVVAWWAVQLLAPTVPVTPATGISAPTALPDLKLASQLFGSANEHENVAAGPSNVEVIGVLAAGSRGSAILAVDGQPPRAYAVGERISPVQRLFEVRPDAVVVQGEQARQEIAAPARSSLSVLTDGPDDAAGARTGFLSAQDADEGPRIAAPLGASTASPAARPATTAARPAVDPQGLRRGATFTPGITPVNPQPERD